MITAIQNTLNYSYAFTLSDECSVQCQPVDCYDSCGPTLTQGDITRCHALVSRLIQKNLLLFVCALIGWTGKCAALKQTIIAASTVLHPLLYMMWFRLKCQLFCFMPSKFELYYCCSWSAQWPHKGK